MLDESCKHILIVGSSPTVLINFRGPLISDILALGHRISVSAPGFSAADRQLLEDMGADVYDIAVRRTGINPFADLAYMRSLTHLMRRIKPDRVLTYTIKPNVWGSFAAANVGVPSFAMVTGLGYLFTKGVDRPTVKKWVLRTAASALYALSTARNRRVIFQNPDDRDDFIHLRCLNDRRKAALVNGSGVDMVHFARVALPNGPSFLMIARLLKSKGIREYAEAAIALRQRYPNIRFRVVGYFDEGHDTVSRSDMDNWVASGLDYTGQMADVRAAIAEASVYVLPSYREGTPRSVLEAMAMGRPVITTDAPGCRETVENGENGYLVPPRDPIALAAAMERFIADPSLIAPMGEAAWKLVRSRYQVESVNREIMQIMEL